MSLKITIYLAVYVVGMVTGQLLFKSVAGSVAISDSLLRQFQAIALSPLFYGAVFLYGGLSVFWVWLLTFIPLSQAYPFVALSIAITMVIGWAYFGEIITFNKALGGIFVVVGVAMIGWEGLAR